MKEVLSFKEWAEEEKPREKLLLKGRKSLTNVELLAILIGTGTKQMNVMELSKKILADAQNSLNKLACFSYKELNRYAGMGESKSITVIAALELGRRRKEEIGPEKQSLRSPQNAYQEIKEDLLDLPYEEFWVLHLNRAGHLIAKQKVGQGGFSQTPVDPRLIFKTCFESSTDSIILCHNHPSGELNPSQEDIRLTREIKQSCQLLGFNLLDHLIIGGTDYYSMAEAGLL